MFNHPSICSRPGNKEGDATWAFSMGVADILVQIRFRHKYFAPQVRPTRVRTHDLQIMYYTFHVPEKLTLTTEPSGTWCRCGSLLRIVHSQSYDDRLSVLTVTHCKIQDTRYFIVLSCIQLYTYKTKYTKT